MTRKKWDCSVSNCCFFQFKFTYVKYGPPHIPYCARSRKYYFWQVFSTKRIYLSETNWKENHLIKKETIFGTPGIIVMKHAYTLCYISNEAERVGLGYCHSLGKNKLLAPNTKALYFLLGSQLSIDVRKNIGIKYLTYLYMYKRLFLKNISTILLFYL